MLYLGVERPGVIEPPVQVDDTVGLRAQAFEDGANGGGFTAADFTGEKPDAAVVAQKLQACGKLLKLGVHEEP